MNRKIERLRNSYELENHREESNFSKLWKMVSRIDDRPIVLRLQEESRTGDSKIRKINLVLI